jgi:shikimate dehydrogenase
MALYGLIGYPLTHSFSPAYFHNKFEKLGIDATYKAFPLAHISDLPALIEQYPEMEGINVTIPYKELVIPYLDAIDPAAKLIEAVNCIHIKDGVRTGYNTDYLGFMQSLKPLLKHQHTHALILGSGGASKAVQYAMQQLGIMYKLVSRSGENDYTYLQLTDEIIDSHKLIINTTPLGMYPNTDICPLLPYNAIGYQHLLYDLVYNPTESKFLLMGKKQKAATKNGYEMLILQADASWDIWNS